MKRLFLIALLFASLSFSHGYGCLFLFKRVGFVSHDQEEYAGYNGEGDVPGAREIHCPGEGDFSLDREEQETNAKLLQDRQHISLVRLVASGAIVIFPLVWGARLLGIL